MRRLRRLLMRAYSQTATTRHFTLSAQCFLPLHLLQRSFCHIRYLCLHVTFTCLTLSPTMHAWNYELLSFKRIFIVHLGVPYSWYIQNYFLQMSKMSEWAKWANEQNEQMSKMNKWANISTHLKKMSKHFYYKMSKMSKWVNEQNAIWANLVSNEHMKF